MSKLIPKAQEMLDVVITELFAQTSEELQKNEFYNEADITPHNFLRLWSNRINDEVEESFIRVRKAVVKRTKNEI